MMNRIPTSLRIAASALLSATAATVAMALAGCAASTSPQHDARFGDSVHRLNEQQRLQPEASRTNEGKTLGADGRTVRASSDRLVESYRTPQANEVQSIGTIGNVGGTSR